MHQHGIEFQAGFLQKRRVYAEEAKQKQDSHHPYQDTP